MGQLKDLLRLAKQASKRKVRLQETQVSQLDQAEIRIEEEIGAQVEVAIGEARRFLSEAMPGAVFKRSGNAIVTVQEAGPATLEKAGAEA